MEREQKSKYEIEKCNKCDPIDHEGIFCRCESRNIAVAKMKREQKNSPWSMNEFEYDIEVISYYPEKDLRKKGTFKGRFDVHIKKFDILYSNVLLFGDNQIYLGGNKYKNKKGIEVIGQFLRMKDPEESKRLQSSIKKACREWIEKQNKDWSTTPP